MTAKTWNADNGQAFQGDVVLMRLPDDIEIDTSEEIPGQEHRLVLAEGEVTGHHHAIAYYRANEGEGGVATQEETSRMLATIAAETKPKLYRGMATIKELVRRNILTTADLAIGVLVVTKRVQALSHDEHDTIRIKPGAYYVGAQREMDASNERRVAD